MKFVNIKEKDETILGVESEKGRINVKAANARFGTEVPVRMEELIQENNRDDISKLIKKVEEHPHEGFFFKEGEVTYAPAVTKPEKILCVGLNYDEHSKESGREETPEEPVIFNKLNNALAAHQEEIPLPKTGEQFDYEAELVLVMGKEAKDVSKEEALSYVFGYSIGNDLSVRDLQFKDGDQWLLGKSPDKFAPVGPYIVSADRIDPSNLVISLKRNGKRVQSSNTKHMVFDCATIISYLSKHMTLKPGDLIFTGTPEGVISGQPESEREWLKSGEELEVAIEGIGSLKNRLI